MNSCGLMLAVLPLLLAGPLLGAEERLKVRSPRPLQAESVMEDLETWETPISGFFIRSHHGVPAVDESRWVLKIDGLVDKPITLTLAELKKMKAKSLHAVLECSGNGRGLQKPGAGGVQWEKGAVGNGEWTGVSLAQLLARAGVKPTARFARIEGADQPAMPSTPPFIRSIPLDKALKEDTLVAWDMNREPMPVLHGGPLRLILPGWYGQNWIKWLTHITLTEEEDQGFYMKKAYRMPKQAVQPGQAWDSSTGAPIEQLLVQSVIVSPVSGQTLGSGEVLVAGKAFSGAGTILKVEISIDSGRSWRPARLEPPHEDGGWQEFSAEIASAPAGELAIWSRATDSAGNTQPVEQQWNPGGYLRNAVDRVAVTIGADALPQGESVARAKCLTCHSAEMIQSQRLTIKQWEGEIKKMESFGAKVDEAERRALLKYFERLSPERPAAEPKYTSYGREAAAFLGVRWPKGDSRRGSVVFAQNCASCHGEHGEGRDAPRLAGRAIAPGEFWSVVLFGRNRMPPFDEALKKQEIADVQSFLSRAVNLP